MVFYGFCASCGEFFDEILKQAVRELRVQLLKPQIMLTEPSLSSVPIAENFHEWTEKRWESYVELEKAIRSLASFYSKAGPSAPLPEEFKSEILSDLEVAEQFL
ncbi:hypothetical protein Ancab_013348 [Ancistrocladus abbreviatus]